MNGVGKEWSMVAVNLRSAIFNMQFAINNSQQAKTAIFSPPSCAA
jgi:hypothetical protein